MAQIQKPSYIQVLTDDVNGPEKCGYCKKEGTHFLEAGIWTFTFTPQNEQYLLERNWRRCGKFIYRLDKDKNCCPLYMIRCDAKHFKPSQSQKKVLRKMTNYLRGTSEENTVKPKEKAKLIEVKIPPITGASKLVVEDAEKTQGSEPVDGATPLKKVPAKGIGADPNKAKCLKAKEIRKLKMLEKLASNDVEGAKPVLKSKSDATPKSLEDYLEDHKYQNGYKHKLETRLIQVNPESYEYTSTEAESYKLYDRYQQKVHNDKPGDNKLEKYKNFLVTSAVAPQASSSRNGKLGCFHLQYFLDGKLFMVGVLDLLPNYVSSVYTYYDPDLMFLSPGVYSALAEIGFTRELQSKCETKLWYCLGYFCNTNQKMRYKGEYYPSELNCLYTHNWISFEKCLPKLEKRDYQRLDELNNPLPVESYIGKCLIWFQNRPIEYSALISKNKDAQKNEAKIRKYCELVGPDFCQKAAAIFNFL